MSLIKFQASFSLFQVWTWTAGGFIFAPLVVVPDASLQGTHSVLVGCYDFYLYCLVINADNQVSLQWKTLLGARIGAAPFPFDIRTCDNRNVCVSVCNSNGQLFILSLHDGSIHSSYHVHAEVFSSPVVHQDRIYFGCRDNFMYCLTMRS